MTFLITIKQSGHQFSVNADEPILTAALRQGIVLPYGCKNGACGTCKGTVVQGKIEQGAHSSSALSHDEKAKGFALFCCAQALSDVQIEIREVAGVGDIPVRKLPCRVNVIERIGGDVIIVKLQLPATERFQYLAGQYIEFIMKDGKRRAYSIANAPHIDGPIELHIRHYSGGVFTPHVFESMKPRDILRFEGPLGTFFLREDSEKPIILLASGTGFAPIKAIVEHIIFKKIQRPMTLFWGGRTKQDLYLMSLAEQWKNELPNFQFIPVLSEPLDEDNWNGKRKGFVHNAVIENFPDLSNYQVYACGAPVMVESAARDFTQHHGLPLDSFFADAFTTTADLINAIK